MIRPSPPRASPAPDGPKKCETSRAMRSKVHPLYASSEGGTSGVLRRQREGLTRAWLRPSGYSLMWCRGRDLNPHALGQTILSRSRLPFRHPGAGCMVSSLPSPGNAKGDSGLERLSRGRERRGAPVFLCSNLTPGFTRTPAPFIGAAVRRASPGWARHPQLGRRSCPATGSRGGNPERRRRCRSSRWTNHHGGRSPPGARQGGARASSPVRGHPSLPCPIHPGTRRRGHPPPLERRRPLRRAVGWRADRQPPLVNGLPRPAHHGEEGVLSWRRGGRLRCRVGDGRRSRPRSACACTTPQRTRRLPAAGRGDGGAQRALWTGYGRRHVRPDSTTGDFRWKGRACLVARGGPRECTCRVLEPGKGVRLPRPQ